MNPVDVDRMRDRGVVPEFFAYAADQGGARAGLQREVRPGVREIYVHYPDGMGRSKLELPAAGSGTARNMNALRRRVAMTENDRAD